MTGEDNTNLNENNSETVVETAETETPELIVPIADENELPQVPPASSEDEADDDILNEVDAYNKAVLDGKITIEDEDDNLQLLPEDEDDPDKNEDPEKADESEEEELDENATGEEADEEIEFEFSQTSDINQFKREREKFLELHGENKIVTTLADEYDRQLAAFQPLAEATQQYGGRDEAVKVLSAFNQLYVLDDTTGEFKPNAEPIAKLLYDECPNEIAQISERFLELPSRKYQGGTILQEIFLDSFKLSPEKLSQITEFIEREDYELPAQILPTPAGVDKTLADAFQRLSENRRAEIATKAGEIQTLRDKLDAELENDPKGYYAREIQKELTSAEEDFADDLDLLKDSQYRIDSEKARVARQETVQKEAETQIFSQTSNNFNEYVGTMIETQADVLASKMVFLDDKMRKPQARAIISRIQGALSFVYDENLDFTPDAMAEYHAKTLRDEGLNYDFEAGRQLFQKQIKIENRIIRLEKANASPRQLNTVRNELTDIKNQIAAEVHSLSAQYSKKFLSSNSQKLKGDLSEAERKNPASRPVVRENTKAGGGKKEESIQDIDRERRLHNQKIQRAIEKGDLEGLKDSYA